MSFGRQKQRHAVAHTVVTYLLAVAYLIAVGAGRRQCPFLQWIFPLGWKIYLFRLFDQL